MTLSAEASLPSGWCWERKRCPASEGVGTSQGGDCEVWGPRPSVPRLRFLGGVGPMGRSMGKQVLAWRGWGQSGPSLERDVGGREVGRNRAQVGVQLGTWEDKSEESNGRPGAVPHLRALDHDEDSGAVVTTENTHSVLGAKAQPG